MSDPTSAQLAEYERRGTIWTRVCVAAQKAAMLELGPVLGAEIEALSKGNGKGFFATLVRWVVEPISGTES
jgi:hypothetical protein